MAELNSKLFDAMLAEDVARSRHGDTLRVLLGRRGRTCGTVLSGRYINLGARLKQD